MPLSERPGTGTGSYGSHEHGFVEPGGKASTTLGVTSGTFSRTHVLHGSSVGGSPARSLSSGRATSKFGVPGASGGGAAVGASVGAGAGAAGASFGGALPTDVASATCGAVAAMATASIADRRGAAPARGSPPTTRIHGDNAMTPTVTVTATLKAGATPLGPSEAAADRNRRPVTTTMPPTHWT